MRDGLGLRFAFMGPMETIHLNAMGLKKYCETYGETIYNVSKTMGEIPSAWLMRNEEDKAKVMFSFKFRGFFYKKDQIILPLDWGILADFWVPYEIGS